MTGNAIRLNALGRLRPDFNENLERPRHRWFPFKEGFGASLVASVLRSVKREPGRVFDPFLGSGTTALEAALWGWNCDGIETNPFMVFLARVKTEARYDPDLVGEVCDRVVEWDGKPDWRLPTDSTLVERRGLDKWLFDRPVARRFEALRAAIYAQPSRKHRRLLLLALVAAMLDVSNARRDGKCWRYKRGWKYRRQTAGDLEAAFRQRVSEYTQDVRACNDLSGLVRVWPGDSRRMDELRGLGGVHSYDCVVTSPPYLNSFDYTDIYRPEMLLLGYARNSRDLRNVRLRTVRSHVQVEWPAAEPIGLSEVELLVRRISRRRTWNGRIGEMVNAYFVDLEAVLRGCVKRTRPGGVVAFVVASSAYGGVVIPTERILAALFERSGLRDVSVVPLRETFGNGHHQRREGDRLQEAMVVGVAAGA